MHRSHRLRQVLTLAALTALLPIASGQPLIDMPMSLVPGDELSGGPVYDYRVGRFEVTNDQYAVFLNDALVNLDNERGQYMYFDTETGSVYIHSEITGTTGSEPGVTFLFDAETNGAITYNSETSLYEVDTDQADHPVTGMSWYGAVKFCNWLTLDQGLDIAQRAYTESTDDDLLGWHPVSISTEDWEVRDLDDDERLDLVDNYAGFRLPMDHGESGASAYSEWYKSAAWLPNADPPDDADYGFGRNILTGADANYLGSGDPFDDGTTPVGYFDGTDHDGAFATTDTENGYGLYDISGNVWEWQTDQGGDDPLSHSLRGGSWTSSDVALLNTISSLAGADAVQTTWGFRVVQSIKDVVQVTPDVTVGIEGPYGGEYDIPEQIYTITNLTPDTILVSVIPDVGWLKVDDLQEVIDLELLGKASIDIVVAVAAICEPDDVEDELVVGLNVGTLTFSNDSGGDDILRVIDLTLTEPISVEPDDTTTFDVEGFFDGPFEDTQIYTLTSESASDVLWTAESDQTDPAWLLIDGADTSGGTLIPPDDVTAEVTVSFDVSANDLDVGTHTAIVTFTDVCTSETIERTVNLIINAPMTLLPEDAIEFEGLFGGPYIPESVELTLTNLLDIDLTWEAEGIAESGAVWLDIDGGLLATGTVLAGEEAVLTLTVNSNADTLVPEIYTVTLNVRDINNPDHVFLIEVDVTLEIVELDVFPTDDLESAGPVGGPFVPSEQVYTITNHEAETELTWQVTSETDSDEHWIDINGGVFAIGVLQAGGTVDVTVAINIAAQTLASGTHEATITFEEIGGGSVERLVILDIGASDPTTPMVIVDGDEVQEGGPTYTYRIGLYEITNAEYAVFLSNALANPDNERGYYMYHDADTGDVYINDSEQGETGAGPGDLTTLMFSATSGEAITYDGVEYVVAEDMDDLPVVGVTWFGAVKFCNWMTVAQGMDAAQRVYHEGPTPEDWFPVTIGSEVNGSQTETYATRDLNDLERADLVADYNGFRLPMDHGIDQAGSYSEWYKAAALIDVEGTEAVYGFGRDVITGLDANFLTSGDPFDDGPTPVGYFDGTDHEGAFATTDTANFYGLYDLTGNVREWMQDFGNDATQRTVRGGQFLSGQAASALQTDTRVSRPREDVQAHTGFRIVQSPTLLPIELVETIPLLADGVMLGPYDPESLTITLLAQTSETANEWRIDLDVDWVEINGEQSSSGVTQPGAGDTIVIDFNEATGELRSPPVPALDLALVEATGADDQPDGPVYDFWISPTEVSNSAYAAFLNDALANLENERGAFMYHDTDSGSVYINTAETGESGDTGSHTLTTLLFDAFVNVRITFDIDDRQSYVIEAGFENHPVVGVTWYGAVKYCNWLTIDQGLDPGVRTYTEGPYAGDWHPVSIPTSEWWGTEDTANEPAPTGAARDLNDGERAELAGNYTGFRLPMDHGSGGAAMYNEWYKAAAWLPDAEPPASALYGFGRDVLSDPDDVCEPDDEECNTDADANYSCSGDPFEDSLDCIDGGSTPSGFYDGTIYNPDGTVDDDQVADEDDETPDFVTAADENGYGLVDVTGNAAEWVQDRGPHRDLLLILHTVRGGHWGDAGDSSALRNTARTPAAPAVATETIGFRVVQSFRAHQAIITVNDLTTGAVTTLPLLLSLSEPVTFTPEEDIVVTGLYGDDFTAESETYTASNASETEMEWEVTVDQTWVTVTTSDDVFDPIPGHDGTDPGTDTVDVEINEEASSLVPGEHVARVTFDNLTTGHSETRLVELTIEQTIDVDPVDPIEVTGIAGGPFEPAVIDYTMTNTIATDLEYSIEVGDVTWLTVEDDDGDGVGTLPGNDPESPDDPVTVQFSVTVNEEADDLDIGDHQATITISDSSFGGVVTRDINITIGAPLEITTGDGLDDFDPIGPFGGPFVPADKTYTLTNLAAFALDWIVTVDQSWLTVDGSDTSDGQLDAGDSVAVSVALSDETLGMSGGEYTGLITFTELHTGFEQTRNVTLNINQGLAVTPLDTYFAYASLQDGMVGEVIPHQFVYQLTNLDAESITYDVLDYPSWILVDGLPDEQELGAGESVAMFVTIDPTAAAALGEDNPVDTITILNSSSGVGDTTRTVSLTLVEPVFDSPTTVAVSGLEDPQPNGPTYRFEIGVTEVTNEQFAVFLNDARDNPDNERGAFMYHDTDSGDVYINDAETGESGETGSDDLITKMFDSSTSAWITFVDDSYVVDPDFEDHPAVGMTWYGAVKYCNWLTIDQGFPPAHRCYLESTFDDLTGWRPATISADDWADGDLNDAERLVLVTDYAGYRLPMDDGANNPDPLTDAADDYNEWYKAAAWNTEADQNTLYGFGRDVITGADANYIASGDPFDDATTPVAYYDGSNQGGSFQTNETDNSFGLYDMSGNVLEMLQGRHNPPGLLVTTRSTSYIQGSQQVSARSGTFAGSPSQTVGFRVLRAPVPLLGDGDGDGDIDLLDMGAFQICFTGPDEPFADPTCSIFDFDADTDIDLVDFAQMQDVITGP